MRTIVYLEDQFNDEHIVFTKSLKPHTIVYLSTLKGLHAGYYEDFADYILTDYPEVNIELRHLEDISIEGIIDVLKTIDFIEGIHLPSSNGLLAIFASKAADALNIPSYFTDLARDNIILFNNCGSMIIKSDIEGIAISEYIDIAGGDILRKTTIFNEDPLIRLLADFIAENQPRWKRIKRLLGRKDVFIHQDDSRGEVEAVLKNLDKSEYLLFKWLKTYLKDIGYLKTKRSKDDNLVLKFKSPDHKQFLFITGSWLETFTYKTIQLLDDVTDIESGLSFSWDFGVERVKNEVDVLATYHSHLFYFSCKDSPSYDVYTLNELSVYAQRIGGQSITKVLVVTDPPRKDGVLERASEMDIHVLLFEGNPVGFRRQIERLFSAVDYHKNGV